MTTASMADRRFLDTRHAGLAAILVLAAFVRVWGLDFGLPHTQARPDEQATVSIALRFFTRTLNPAFFDWPSLFMYAVAACFVAYFQVGRLIGWFPYESTFVAAGAAHPAPLFLIARGLSAASGVLTVAAIYAAGLRLFDRITGLIGAFFLACAALHVRDSHFGVTDVAATSLVTLSFLFTAKFASSGRHREAIVSALWTGLAASTKYNAALIALPLSWAILRSRESWNVRIGLLASCGLVAGVAFVAGTPYAVLDWQAFAAALESVAAHLRAGHAALAGPGWVVHLSTSLRYGLGLPLLVTGVAGLVLSVWRDRGSGLLLALFPVAYYVLIGSGQTAFARYIIPVVPFLCLAAAHFLVVAAGVFGRRLRRPAASPLIAWVFAAAVAAPSVMATVQTDRLLARTDNRLIAARWIRDRYPDGATIAQNGSFSGNVHMAAADPALAARYQSVDFHEPTGSFSTATSDKSSTPLLIIVVECPLPYCEAVSERLRGILRDDYERQQEFVAFDASSRSLVYDRDDDFYVPLAGMQDVMRPGPNLIVYRRRRP
jgi:4-amino-4-deoxy-L-arabinose transferase-like glycosyltransferase